MLTRYMSKKLIPAPKILEAFRWDYYSLGEQTWRKPEVGHIPRASLPRSWIVSKDIENKRRTVKPTVVPHAEKNEAVLLKQNTRAFFVDLSIDGQDRYADISGPKKTLGPKYTLRMCCYQNQTVYIVPYLTRDIEEGCSGFSRTAHHGLSEEIRLKKELLQVTELLVARTV